MKYFRAGFALGWRGVSGAIAVSVAILILVGLSIVAQGEANVYSQKHQDAQVQANVLAATSSAAVDFLDPEGLKEAVSALGANPEIKWAQVQDTKGNSLATFRQSPEAHSQIVKNFVSVPGTIVGRSDIRIKNKVIGHVVVGMSVEPMARRVNRYLVIGVLVLLAVLFIVVLGVSQTALRRVNRILETRARELVEANSALHVQMEERHKAETQLQQAQKMQALGQLTGGIAHDFNNLLQAMVGSLDLINRSTEDSRLLKWAGRGLEAGARATKLTGQLLAFSRIQKLQLKPVSVSPLLLGAQELLTSTIGPNHSIVLNLSANDPTVMADPTQLELAIMNLAINARDSMPEGGEIHISTHLAKRDGTGSLPAGTYLSVAVTDTGQGMSSQVIEHAFEPFFTTKGVGKGTGLGLSMVYGMAEQSGGTACIDSTEGKGTTVEILLPLVDTAVASDKPKAAGKIELPAGLTALVVDDDSDVLDINRAMMEGLGFKVFDAVSGEQAIELMKKKKPDLILMDFLMPGLNGVETVERIMKNGRGQGKCPPTLFVTGFSNSDAIRKVMPEANVLMKPFDSAQLKQAVSRTLKAV
jgi:signal transduction histidine kinase/ActR/RegA family two-component response regulator